MTETQWLACNDPGPMLEFLRGRASDRKLRLFAVACCRRIWERLNIVSRRAVEVAEQYADQVANRRDMTLLFVYADAIGLNTSASVVVAPDADRAAHHTAIFAARHVASDTETSRLRTAERAEATAQADLLRDIFPNPFRPPPFIDPAVLAWNGGAVVRLAGEVYEANAWERMGELGRTLEQAGCRDQDMLGHCGEQGRVHVRGCWLVDRLLEKE